METKVHWLCSLIVKAGGASLVTLAFAFVVLAIGSVAYAEEAPAEQAKTEPVHLSLVYTGDTFVVADGGAKRGAVYVDRLMVSADFDFDRLFGWKGANAHVDVMSNRGGAPNEDAGTMMGISRTELDPRPARLVQAYVRQSFANDRAELVLGFYDIGADFYATPSAEMFMGPIGGLAPELSASGPPDFPETALTAQLKVKPTGHSYILMSAADARQGVVGDVGGADFSFRDGLILATEVGYAGNFKAGIGAWRYTRRKPDIRDLTAAGDPVQRATQGAYLLVEYPLPSPTDGVRKTTVFLKGGVTDGATTAYSGTLAGGVLVEHVFAARPDSTLALGFIHGRFDDRFRANQADNSVDAGRAETNFEISYADRIAPHVTLQPDFQWVHHPSGERAIKDALVPGLRFNIELP